MESPADQTSKATEYMDALLGSLREEAELIWLAGGGDALLEDGEDTPEHATHRDGFCAKLLAEALHEMLTQQMAGPSELAGGRDTPELRSAGVITSAGDCNHVDQSIVFCDGQDRAGCSQSSGCSHDGRELDSAASLRRVRDVNEVRKKDSPDDDDERGLAALEHAQRVQKRLVERHFRDGKPQQILASSSEHLLEAREWQAPQVEDEEDETTQFGFQLYGNLYSLTPPTRLRRVVDGFATAAECRAACGYCIQGMHCMFRRGGQTSLAVARGMLERRMGGAGSDLICELVERTRLRIVRDFCLSKRAEPDGDMVLFESGALLTRLQAEWDRDIWDISGEEEHPYWNAHVDKANVASYDYAALLYLNSQSDHFDGGDFAFIDPGADCVVSPRRGRLLTFTAGPENLHQVRKVTRGTRFVLAMWYTLSADHRQKPDE